MWGWVNKTGHVPLLLIIYCYLLLKSKVLVPVSLVMYCVMYVECQAELRVPLGNRTRSAQQDVRMSLYLRITLHRTMCYGAAFLYLHLGASTISWNDEAVKVQMIR